MIESSLAERVHVVRTYTHLLARAVIAMLMLSACARSGSAPGDATHLSDSLEGAWRSRIRFESGALASMKDLEFMYVINQGGTLTESSNYDAAPPVPPAYGVWRSTGPRQFEAKYVFYITAAPKKLEDVTSGGGWSPAGFGVFNENIQLSRDGQTYSSTIDYSAFDTQGKPTGEGSGKAQGSGKRFGFDTRGDRLQGER
jgi:hypothetical protein